MFVRLGLLVLLLAAIPALVLAGGTDLENPENDEFGDKTESQLAANESQEPEIELQLSPEPVYPKMFDVIFGAGLGYGFSAGDFYSALDSGLLLLGDMRIAVSAKTYIKFGYRNMNIFNETQVDDPLLGTHEKTIDVRQYLFSIGWLFSPSKNYNRRMYLELGAGVGDHVVTNTYESWSFSYNDSKFMLVGQFGLIVPFNKTSLGMDAGVSVLWKATSGSYEEGRGALLAAHLGLVLMLGGG